MRAAVLSRGPPKIREGEVPMLVVGFNGSARKGGNTTLLLRHAFTELEKEGIETELVELSGKRIRGCTACYKCFTNKDRRCAVKGDAANDCIAKIDGADGILLGSPTYFTDVTAEMKGVARLLEARPSPRERGPPWLQ